jgi:RNA polymerase sigma factor (sigma-70 family)
MRSALIAASTAPDATSSRLGGALLRTQADTRLAQLAGEGSNAAFEEIVRRYRSGLVAFASRISSRDSADDVVQDSMVKAHHALLRGDRPETPRSWLFRIVRNTALNDRRDNRVHERLDENYDGVEQPPEAVERRHQLRDLVVAMRKLPRAQREALVQRELEGKGHEQIADSLDLSPGAVRQLIFRARSALRAGISALLPIQLLRAAVLSGATDQASTGAAATGAGLGAKLGIGALVTTGALFAGTHTAKEHVTPVAGHHGAAIASATAHSGVSVDSVRHSGNSATAHRHQVIVAPKATSTKHVAAPSSHSPSYPSQGPSDGAGGHGTWTPPPTSSGGGGGGGSLPGGGGAQNYSAPSSKDWPDGGDATGPPPEDGGSTPH